MKLYYMPGACSLSPHIVSREAGLNLEVVRPDLKSADFLKLNPKGYIPVLQLDDGQVLTEGVAIVQYLADQKPEAKLAPKNGTLERYRLQEWLNYIATELHKGFSPLFRKPEPAARQQLIAGLEKKFTFVSQHLEKNAFVLGESFTVADAYLYTVLTWTKGLAIDLSPWTALKAWFDKVAARPSVVAAHQAERS